MRPVGGEDVVGPSAEQEGVGALICGTDLRPGDLVHQGRLPAAEREPDRVLLWTAGCLPDEVEGREHLDVNEAHAVLPVSWLSRSQDRPSGNGRLIAATASDPKPSARSRAGKLSDGKFRPADFAR